MFNRARVGGMPFLAPTTNKHCFFFSKSRDKWFSKPSTIDDLQSMLEFASSNLVICANGTELPSWNKQITNFSFLRKKYLTPKFRFVFLSIWRWNHRQQSSASNIQELICWDLFSPMFQIYRLTNTASRKSVLLFYIGRFILKIAWQIKLVLH